MKKVSITLGVVFCIFILCSLTYQPIVANESLDSVIENKNVIKESNVLGWDFPIICRILCMIVYIGFLLSFVLGIDLVYIIDIAYSLGKTLNCWNTMNYWPTNETNMYSMEQAELQVLSDVPIDDCGCDKELSFQGLWNFPIICTILSPIAIFLWIMLAFTQELIFRDIFMELEKIGEMLGCWWV